MQKFAFVLLFIATLVFAQLFPNWPETSESPIAAYILAGILLIMVLSLLIAAYLYKNNKSWDDYKYRERKPDDE